LQKWCRKCAVQHRKEVFYMDNSTTVRENQIMITMYLAYIFLVCKTEYSESWVVEDLETIVEINLRI
jgi:hypothetical protein